MDEIADTFDTPLKGVSDIAGHTLLNVTSMPRLWLSEAGRPHLASASP
jgi:hypothetical protein